MGPDEFVTRNEFSLVIQYFAAKIQQQVELNEQLIAFLLVKEVLTAQDVVDLRQNVKSSDAYAIAQHAFEKLREIAEIRDVLRRYEENPEEPE